jgi:hypothetical protein
MTARKSRPGACFIAGAVLCGVFAAANVAAQGLKPGSSLGLGTPGAASSPRVATPARGSDEECRNRWQEYRRSQACFARYRTVSGVKPEAFKACGAEVLDPSPDCGPAR